MNDTPTPFPYTRGLKSYLGSIAPFLLLVVLEGGIFLFLILSLARGAARFGFAAGLTAFFSIPIFAVLLAPVWTRHRLGSETLELRFGWDRLAIPLDWIATARPVEERLTLSRVKVVYEGRRQRLVACFSEQGQILLELDGARTLAGKVRHRGAVRQVLFNVDRRDDLLAALAARVSARADVTPPGLEAPDACPPALPRLVPATRAARDGWAIETRALSRRYGQHLAVDGLDLRVGYGEIYGFLGPNGAGKTTTIKMLVGLLEPTAGEVFLDGAEFRRDALRAKRAFGYVPDRAHLYDRLTGREFLELIAQMRSLPLRASQARIEELLDLLQLEAAADALCGTYSFGMKRKLGLAAALLHRPRVLILDEPFNGLDPRSARRLKDLLRELAGEGCGLLMSTHDLATAEAVCHRLGVLHRGRLVAEGRSVGELRANRGDEQATGGLEEVFLQLTEEDEGGALAEGSAA